MGKETVKDQFGAEYSLEWNTGTVTKVERPGAGRRNAQVFFAVPSFTSPVQGWIDTGDPSFGVVEQALSSKATVAFRVEVHRKRNVDKAVSFAELDRNDKARRLISVAVAGTRDAANLIAGAETDAGHRSASSQPTTSNDGDPRERLSTNREGLDSYAYLAKAGMVDLAFETLVGLKHAEKITGFFPKDIKALAGALLQAADATQASVNSGDVDRGAMSHTRARGAIRTALANNPVVTLEPDDAWIAAITKTATTLMNIALELV